MRSYGWLLAALIAPWLGETDGLAQRAAPAMSSPRTLKPAPSSRRAQVPGLQQPPASPLRIFDPRDPLASARAVSVATTAPLVLPEINFNKPGVKGVEELEALFTPRRSGVRLEEENEEDEEKDGDDDDEEGEGLAALEQQWQAEWERELAAEGRAEDEDDDDDDDTGGSSGIGLEVLPSSRSAPTAPAPSNLVIHYLQTELRLSEATLMKVGAGRREVGQKMRAEVREGEKERATFC